MHLPKVKNRVASNLVTFINSIPLLEVKKKEKAISDAHYKEAADQHQRQRVFQMKTLSWFILRSNSSLIMLIPSFLLKKLALMLPHKRSMIILTKWGSLFDTFNVFDLFPYFLPDNASFLKITSGWVFQRKGKMIQMIIQQRKCPCVQ